MNELIQKIIREEQGNRKIVCAKLKITNSYLSFLLNGKRTLSKNLATRIKTLYPKYAKKINAIRIQEAIKD